MKIDLSVSVTEEIRKLISGLTTEAKIPPYAQLGHLGTHFDVMDKTFPLDNTERRGLLFDISGVKGREVSESDIDMSRIAENDFVIFNSGCLKEYGYATYEYLHTDVELSDALISTLTKKRVSMIGVDFPGIRKGAGHMRADKYCADMGVFVVENLANLEVLWKVAGEREFLVHTYPLSFAGLTGLPCRVVAEMLEL